MPLHHPMRPFPSMKDSISVLAKKCKFSIKPSTRKKQGKEPLDKIKAGARVRVTVTVVATTRRYHVAVSDPLPAGLEPEFAQTSNIIYPPGGWWRGWWSGWEHTNLRDDRGEAFTSLLWEGVHTFTYTTRATTPGTFVVPPAKAEEMYSPETFGRSAGTKVQIVE